MSSTAGSRLEQGKAKSGRMLTQRLPAECIGPKRDGAEAEIAAYARGCFPSADPYAAYCLSAFEISVKSFQSLPTFCKTATYLPVTSWLC